jgi:predicted DsbA family dithiol-disulfide isomerase
MKIDFVSDVSCPWCAIGLHALEQALARVAPDIQATVLFQPFELNPQMGAQGQEIVEHLSGKYGINAEQIAANSEAIRQRGAAVGFEFGLRTRIYNTFDAHRMLQWAGEQDLAKQGQLKHALLRAYHGQGLNPSDPDLLRHLAEEVGLDGDEAQRLIESDLYAEDVRAAEAFWQRHGIHSVPAVIINERHLISGGQPPDVFEQALRQIAASEG